MKDPYADLSDLAIYKLATKHIQTKKFAEAIKDYEALEANYPYGKYADKAKLGLLYAYYCKKEYPQARATAERFLRMYPNHRHADYAHYMQALANYDQYYSTMYRLFQVDRYKREPTLAINAFDHFKNLLLNFPRSKYALDANQRMIHLRNQIADYELTVANYYLAKQAYLAAANRAMGIINDLDQSLATEAALKIMLVAYRELNIPELEINANNLLNANFSPINSYSAKK